MNAQNLSFGSAYFIEADNDPMETHMLAVLVDNEPGVLARVIGLFSGRGVRAKELGQDGPIERELALIKVACQGAQRVEALRLSDAFHAKVVDATTDHFIFEVTGKSAKIDQFIAIMRPLGLVEICRTGVSAMNRGPEGM